VTAVARHEFPPERVKCLLVDDLEENLLALEALLRQDDVEILKARSGREALELVLVHDIALALLDVQMPEMDGFELAELMRGTERTRNIPIIFVTAGARDWHRTFKGYDTGAVDFLYKPLEPHILRNKAEVFFQLYRQKQQLAQQLVELSETLRLNEMFTAVLGHDLRNPLSAILTTADVLERRIPDEAVQRAAVRIRASGKRMAGMIEDVLDLARARLGNGIPVKPEPGDLALVAQRVVQEHQVTNPPCPIELTAQGDLTGSWDGNRLAQVTSNLIGNALQHGRQEHPVRVLLDGTALDRVVLSVSNAGTIPWELLPRLFDPFRSGEQSQERKGGLGLGLYIVQQIVQGHGGKIDVTSGEGPGSITTFRVELPRGSSFSLTRS
jgi:two-component system sensor histidine kinase/response regulator